VLLGLHRPCASLEERTHAEHPGTVDRVVGPFQRRGDRPEDVGGGRPSTDTSGFVDQLANPLVTRASQTEPLSFAADAPVRLGDRLTSTIEADDRLEQT